MGARSGTFFALLALCFVQIVSESSSRRLLDRRTILAPHFRASDLLLSGPKTTKTTHELQDHTPPNIFNVGDLHSEDNNNKASEFTPFRKYQKILLLRSILNRFDADSPPGLIEDGYGPGPTRPHIKEKTVATVIPSVIMDVPSPGSLSEVLGLIKRPRTFRKALKRLKKRLRKTALEREHYLLGSRPNLLLAALNAFDEHHHDEHRNNDDFIRIEAQLEEERPTVDTVVQLVANSQPAKTTVTKCRRRKKKRNQTQEPAAGGRIQQTAFAGFFGDIVDSPGDGGGFGGFGHVKDQNPPETKGTAEESQWGSLTSDGNWGPVAEDSQWGSSVPESNQWGSVSEDTQWGSVPESNQWGSAPESNQWGSVPEDTLWGDVPESNQWGSAPESNQWGSVSPLENSPWSVVPESNQWGSAVPKDKTQGGFADFDKNIGGTVDGFGGDDDFPGIGALKSALHLSSIDNNGDDGHHQKSLKAPDRTRSDGAVFTDFVPLDVDGRGDEDWNAWGDSDIGVWSNGPIPEDQLGAVIIEDPELFPEDNWGDAMQDPDLGNYAELNPENTNREQDDDDDEYEYVDC